MAKKPASPKKRTTLRAKMAKLERKMLPLYKKGDRKGLAKLYKQHDSLNAKYHAKPKTPKAKPTKPSRPPSNRQAKKRV